MENKSVSVYSELQPYKCGCRRKCNCPTQKDTLYIDFEKVYEDTDFVNIDAVIAALEAVGIEAQFIDQGETPLWKCQAFHDELKEMGLIK